MDNKENSEPDFKNVHPVTFYFIFGIAMTFSGLTFCKHTQHVLLRKLCHVKHALQM
uniref:Uncharacterized protein n=1 Tax=Anguilla anguilla TaxID=7936 RepID=A0A0E9R4A8_ANGAN